MRKSIIFTSVIALSMASPAFAAKSSASKEEKIGVGAGAVIGAIAGGPVGLIIGATIGAKVGDEFHERNDEIDGLQASLSTSETKSNTLQGDLQQMNNDIDRLTADLQQARQVARPELLALMQAGIEMDLLFKTDEHALNDSTSGRLRQMAASLAGMSDVYIKLDGFADERGDETYNQELSVRRVDYVRDVLVANGVDAARIRISAHGESPVTDKTVDNYALQRKVSLTLYVSDKPSFAANP